MWFNRLECLRCNKNYQQKFNEKLAQRFANTCKFSNYDNNNFILLLHKGVYPYQYIDDSKKSNETINKGFFSQLKM